MLLNSLTFHRRDSLTFWTPLQCAKRIESLRGFQSGDTLLWKNPSRGNAMLTRDEQRTRHQLRSQLAVGLWCHLHNLMEDVLAGDVKKAQEFQQFIQYAPQEMREEILEKLEAKNEESR